MSILGRVVLGLVFCLPASAQYGELGVTAGYGLFGESRLFFSGSEQGSSQLYELDDGIRVGARMSFDFRGYFAHEAVYAWQRGRLKSTTDDRVNQSLTVREDTSSIHHYYYNFTAHATRRDTRVRPFVTGGVGVSSFIPPGYGSFSGRGETKFGYNYGGGLKFLLSERYGLRFDVRDHVTGKPFFRDASGRLHNLETSMTFSFLF